MGQQDILIPILAGTFLFIVLSAFINLLIYLFKKKRSQYLNEMVTLKQSYEQALLQAQVEIQESTFRHIAKELHDNVGQLLSTTKMLMGVTEIRLANVPDTLLTANATLSKAIEETRFLSRSLDKEWLEQFNFLDNLKSEVERINAGEVVKAAIHCAATISMKAEEQIILFRIVQEAVQNALRHARPTQLDVMISNREEALEVKVANNGTPLPENFHGMGTNNMRHRARLFGGTVQWTPVHEGTIVTICLPLKNTA